MTNPNPTRNTAPMWKLWTHRPNKAWKLGGLYVDFKKGYHNSVNNNKRNWPGTYSVRLPLDIGIKINQDVGRAIDVTMSDAEMRKITARMKRSALDPNDPRLDAVKEFFGTLDSVNVYGLTKDSETGEWRKASADKTHLWHLHMGLFAFFVNDEDRIDMILSVWTGESVQEWRKRTMTVKFSEKGDSGEEVKYWQTLHNAVRTTVDPSAIAIKVDGDYGDATAKAFADFVHKGGGQAGYNGDRITHWLALRYEKSFIIMNTPPPSAAIPIEKLESLVNAWLLKHVPNDLTISATLKGKVEL